jgi:hypothetical protein
VVRVVARRLAGINRVPSRLRWPPSLELKRGNLAVPSIHQLPVGLAVLGSIALLISVLVSAGCASTISGQVLDAQTGDPVPWAVVLGVWMFAEGAPGLVHSELVGVREAETDAEGRFTLESRGGPLVEQRVTVYKFGYQAWSNLFSFPPLRRREKPAATELIRLERRSSDLSPVDHLLFIDLARSAGLYGYDSDPKFQTAIDRERDLR